MLQCSPSCSWTGSQFLQQRLHINSHVWAYINCLSQSSHNVSKSFQYNIVVNPSPAYRTSHCFPPCPRKVGNMRSSTKQWFPKIRPHFVKINQASNSCLRFWVMARYLLYTFKRKQSKYNTKDTKKWQGLFSKTK